MPAVVKKVMTITLVVKSVLGFSMGVYEATCGAYFYERFGGAMNSGTAIMLATILLAARQGLITLLEIPTGALADTIGRVQVVVISWVARTIFFVCLAAMWFCNSTALAVTIGAVASIFWAICYTCFNGAFSAWCVDYLKENAPEYPYSILVSYSHNYFTTSMAIGTPIGIFFYLQGYPSLIYAVVALSCFLCMGYSLMQMKDTRSLQFVDRHQINYTSILRTMRERFLSSCSAFRFRPALFWIVMTFGIFIFLLNIVQFLWPIFLKETTGAEKWSWMWVTLAMGGNIACALSSRLFVWVSRALSKIHSTANRLNYFLLLFTGVSIVSAFMVVWHGYATSYGVNNFILLVATVLTVLVSYGFMGACFETLVNYYIGDNNDQERATIISSGSFVRGVLFVFLAVPSAGSTAADSPIYWAAPAGLLFVSALATLLIHVRKKGEEPIASSAM